ncbi:MAG: cytidylate kinase-like family protein [Prevotellaceae bacterium]|jgi:cytidylate kinase|nr:cytidylate kinase-like family protein [Prevotellaceae bacterium]
MKTITIGRQFGAGGMATGKILSEKLNIPCYDKELIMLASKKSGLGSEFFEKADEKSSFSIFGVLGNVLGGFFSGIFSSGQSNNYLSNEMLFNIQSKVIKEIAEKESAIFLGRCADYILREKENLTTIFIYANLKDRIKRISEQKNISEKEAKNLIEQCDKKRSSYYNYYSDKTWGDAKSYDLCINSSILGIEKTAEFVLNFVQH